MRSIIEFFVRFGAFFLFLFLEIICLVLIVNFNPKQETVFNKTLLQINGYFQSEYQSVIDYLHLRETADSLKRELAILKSQKIKYITYERNIEDSLILIDTQFFGQFISAPVVSKSIDQSNNYLLLKTRPNAPFVNGMGVVSKDGVVGITQNSSPPYINVLPIIHSESRISAKISSNQYFGNLVWQGGDCRYAHLSAIPKHARIEIGDTIVTSGYSSIFPASIPIGVISAYTLPFGSNFYDISVKLFVDFGNIDHVYLIQPIDTFNHQIIDPPNE